MKGERGWAAANGAEEVGANKGDMHKEVGGEGREDVEGNMTEGIGQGQGTMEAGGRVWMEGDCDAPPPTIGL